METMLEDTTMRELDCRSGDGIEVRLLWEQRSDSVFVAVADERTGDRFRICIDPAAALDAFQHPYAYDHARLTGHWRL